MGKTLEHFIFAGGGTGGHIFPGLAVAHELGCTADGPRRAHFVCSSRAVDRTALDGQPVASVTPVVAQPFGLRPKLAWRCLKSWGPTVREVRRLIAGLRQSGSVRMIATGGFVAAPAVQAARVDGVPLVVLNIDAVPGKANWFIAWRAGSGATVLTTFALGQPYARSWRVIAPIVRASAKPPGDGAMCKRALGLDPHRPVLMVTGGSLGAASLSGLLPLLAKSQAGALRAGGWQVLHQVGRGDGPLDVAALERIYAEVQVPARVVQFCSQMGLWWGAADLAISRAGAGSVAEAWASAVPTIFLPYPYHKDQHQVANAKPLEVCGGAVIVTDRIDPKLTLAGGTDAVIEGLLADGTKRAAMRRALLGLGPVDGAAQVARAVLKLEGDL